MEWRIRTFRPEDEAAVVALWHRCDLVQPGEDPGEAIRTKQREQAESFLVATREGRIVGTAMAGFEGHRGWLNLLAVDPDCRGQGIGAGLLREVEERLAARGCPKLNLQVRRWNASVVAFYEHLGYRVEDQISMGKRLSPTRP